MLISPRARPITRTKSDLSNLSWKLRNEVLINNKMGEYLNIILYELECYDGKRSIKEISRNIEAYSICRATVCPDEKNEKVFKSILKRIQKKKKYSKLKLTLEKKIELLF